MRAADWEKLNEWTDWVNSTHTHTHFYDLLLRNMFTTITVIIGSFTTAFSTRCRSFASGHQLKLNHCLVLASPPFLRTSSALPLTDRTSRVKSRRASSPRRFLHSSFCCRAQHANLICRAVRRCVDVHLTGIDIYVTYLLLIIPFLPTNQIADKSPFWQAVSNHGSTTTWAL